jgi:hypothetical protein
MYSIVFQLFKNIKMLLFEKLRKSGETFQFVSEMTLSIKHQLSAQSNTI